MVLPKQKTVEDAVAARLRRVCEKKPSGRCHVPPEIHELWKQGGDKRDELEKIFLNVGENKDYGIQKCYRCVEVMDHTYNHATNGNSNPVFGYVESTRICSSTR